MGDFILKGDIAYSENKDVIKTYKDSYLVCINGVSKGVYETIPEEYSSLDIEDYTGKLIIPGLVDMHIHAPQYTFRGIHMDLELLEWLNNYTFPEESRYSDIDYADRAYSIFVSHLQRSATTRACIFATIHDEATSLLMDKLEKSGLITYVGMVSMDQNAPDSLCDSIEGFDEKIKKWLDESNLNYNRTFPILTPRFIPTCSSRMLTQLKKLEEERALPVQSHLSENPNEVQWVKELVPQSKFYGDAYDMYSLFGSHGRTVMAHCVYSSDEEVALMNKNGVYVAHCPSSNLNLGSGIAPIRKYIDKGLNIGLGSDVAGGESESLFNEIKKGIEASKMYSRYIDSTSRPVTFTEMFYIATLGGGSFFGKVGSFREGYECDILVIDEADSATAMELSIEERLERDVYTGLDMSGICAKYVAGERINI